MSICALHSVHLIGRSEDKAAAIAGLQDLGCTQIIPLGQGAGERPPRISSNFRDAFIYLATARHRRHQVERSAAFVAIEVERQALALKQRHETLEEERGQLADTIDLLKPWGDFRACPSGELDGYRLWFYAVPLSDMDEVVEHQRCWQLIRKDRRLAYVVVIAREEPNAMPVPRLPIGDRSRAELDIRLEEVLIELEEVEATRESLTRWLSLYAASLADLEDLEARERVACQTWDHEDLFVLRAWAPQERLDDLAAFSVQHSLALISAAPESDEQPPTLFRNRPLGAAGTDLVNFYMTPGYRTWDPSSVVMITFALFYAMILSDAGYALCMAGIGWTLRRKLAASESGRRFRTTWWLITGASFAYGALVGSWFGVMPLPGSLLAGLHWLDMEQTGTMMAISVAIGIVHLFYGNLRHGLQTGGSEGLPSIGWSLVIAGGGILAIILLLSETNSLIPLLQSSGIALMLAGGILIAGFSGRGSPMMRIFGGLTALFRITSAFGDVLSYLRLFALGLASAKLAQAFNGMAADIEQNMPGIGLLLALLVLAFGHTLNFVLSLTSGFIHGLRLNFIEFFNWAIEEEGHLFRPFQRTAHKEQ